MPSTHILHLSSLCLSSQLSVCWQRRRNFERVRQGGERLCHWLRSFAFVKKIVLGGLAGGGSLRSYTNYCCQGIEPVISFVPLENSESGMRMSALDPSREGVGLENTQSLNQVSSPLHLPITSRTVELGSQKHTHFGMLFWANPTSSEVAASAFASFQHKYFDPCFI